MKILLVNDDGYRAKGINAIFNKLKQANYDVTIIAPELNSSGAGQSITVYEPIKITQVSKDVYYVNGTPADCIRIGLQEIYYKNNLIPDLVISGINMGENIGDDVFYSGTVGAAREGMFHGISGLAISTNGPEFNYLDDASLIVLDLLEKLIHYRNDWVIPFLWNINIPNRPYANILGYEATKLGRLGRHKPLVRQDTPRGDIIFWQGESSLPDSVELGTDIYVYLKQDKVSITPLELLPTDYFQLPIIDGIYANCIK
jgi:5'-nucleotidase